MIDFKLSDHPHRRFNVLTGEWILVSPHRAQRPWQGQEEDIPEESLPMHDPACYLCPGNSRAGIRKNPDYAGTFVFDNDFSALHEDTPAIEFSDQSLLIAHSEPGICRVVCFSHRHDLTLAEMDVQDIRRVVDIWTEEYRSLGNRPFIRYIQIFENKGRMMGCSNPHPHGQIWAESSVPLEPAKEMEQMKKYFLTHKKSLLADYLQLEINRQERIVTENDGFVVLVPFWAVWPFETMIVSRRHFGSLIDMNPREMDSLADILKRLTTRYDNLFRTSFPYSAGIHQSPNGAAEHPEWHFHMHFYPPLLRSALIKKFMVGYEMLCNPQRDITPETSAKQLRAVKEIHYKQR